MGGDDFTGTVSFLDSVQTVITPEAEACLKFLEKEKNYVKNELKVTYETFLLRLRVHEGRFLFHYFWDKLLRFLK